MPPTHMLQIILNTGASWSVCWSWTMWKYFSKMYSWIYLCFPCMWDKPVSADYIAFLYSILFTCCCFCLMSYRGIWQWVNVQNLEGHCGGAGGRSANVRLRHPFQVERKHFTLVQALMRNNYFFAFCMKTVCMFPGWKTGSQFTQQMWSSLRGSWSSTPRKCAICFTWSSSWTQIQTSDCLAEVLMSPMRTYIPDVATVYQ